MFAICIESSHLRGMGHLYRSMNFADELIQRGRQVHFFLNDDDASKSILRKRGFHFDIVDLSDHESCWEAEMILKKGIKLWINDRLNTTQIHAEKIIREKIPLVTFDDRGEGANKANLNIAALCFNDIEKLKGDRVLHGIDYLILNKDIVRYRHQRKSPQPLLVTLGGSDSWGVTVKVVSLLVKQDMAATVILGPGFKHNRELEKCINQKITIKRNVYSLVKEMSNYGLAITGGGITPFEANAAGLPCLVIATEDFEEPVGRALQKIGGSLYLGKHDELNEFCADITCTKIKEMSKKGIEKFCLDGVKNVVDHVESLLRNG